MSDKPIGEIVGRHDSASASTAPETGASAAAGDSGAASSATKAEATSATGEATAPGVDPIAGLKSALDKEREARSKFEKESKREARERARQAQVLDAAQRELADLRAKVNRPDPAAVEGEYWNAPHEFSAKQAAEAAQALRAEIHQQRVEEGKELARDRFEDFEDAESAFLEAAARDQSLWSKLPQGSPLTLATRVYKAGKQILAGGETSPMSEIEKLKAEIAELKAGRDGGQTSAGTETVTAPAPKPTVPRSNVGTRGSGVGSTTTWAGPTPINKVFGRQRSAR